MNLNATLSPFNCASRVCVKRKKKIKKNSQMQEDPPCLPENTTLLENEGKNCLGPLGPRHWMECGTNDPFNTRCDLACSPLCPSAGLDISGQLCDMLHDITPHATPSVWLETYSPVYSQPRCSVRFARHQLPASQISCQSQREMLRLMKTPHLAAQNSSLILALTLFPIIFNLSLGDIEVRISIQLLCDFPKHTDE